MSMQEPSEYLELSSQAYSLYADTIAAANARAIEYWKSAWQLAFRPYNSAAFESAVRENLDRAGEIARLTAGEVSSAGERSAEFSERLAGLSAKMQETFSTATRALAETGTSNLKFVKDNADRQIDELTKRFEQMQGAASAN